MGRAPVVIALLVLAGFAVFRFEPFLTKDRQVVASSPSPPPIYGMTPVALPGQATACLDQMPYDTHSQVFQLSVVKAPKSSPALDITFKAKGYRDRVRIPGGYREGVIEVDVRPPKRSLLGTMCMRNTGAKPVEFQGSTEGRTQSRPNLKVNGAPVAIRLANSFRERGPANLISRTGAIVDHSATFKPLPLWLVWPLGLLALIGIPALTLVAFRRSAEATPGNVADPGATAAPVPLPWLGPALRRTRPFFTRGRALAARIPAPWAFGVLLVVVGAYLLAKALRSHGFQLDEDAYVYFARFTREHLPDSLWNTTVINRGLQRLEPWVLMFPLALFKGSVAFPIGHVINVAAFISAGVPAYLIARNLGLAGGWRVLAAFLTLVVPWAVVATTFLSEPLGYPAFCWSVWAVWRAAADPRPRRDLLALGLILLACFARSSMIVLFPLLYVAVFAQVLRFGPRSRRELLGLHWPLLAFVGAVIAGLILSKAGALPQVDSLTGYYGTSPQGISSAFLHKNWIYVSRVAIGTGFIPIVVGGAWLVARVVRPRDATTYALAVAALGSILLVLYSNATAGTDERYIIYVAFPLAIATAVAFARREAPWLLVAVAGVLTVGLIYHETWSPGANVFAYFVGPAETFYSHAVLLRLSVWHQGHDPRTTAVIFELLIVAACAVAMTRHRLATRATVVLMAGLVFVQVLQTNWVVGRFIDQAMAGPGPGLDQRAWVDERLWGKAKAGYWAVANGNSADYGPIAREVQFWNGSIASVIGVDEPVGATVPPGDDLISMSHDPQTGRVLPVPEHPHPHLPPYLVVPTDGLSAVYGTLVEKATYVPLGLVKWKPPLRLRWTITGASADGWLVPGPATVRVFGSPLTPRTGQCLSVDIRSHAGWKGDWLLTAERYRRREAIGPEALARIEVPLRGIASGHDYEDVTLTGLGKRVTLEDGRIATLQLAALETKPCGG